MSILFKILAFTPFALIAGLILRKKKGTSSGSSSSSSSSSFDGIDDYSQYPVGTNMNLPRGVRNFNPGNIKINPSNNWQGVVKRTLNTDGTFEQFKEMKYGVRALFRLMLTYLRQNPTMTLRQFIFKYAPELENNSEAYLIDVANSIGQPIDGKVSSWFSNENSRKKFAKAIIKHENGRNIADKDINDGYNLAF